MRPASPDASPTAILARTLEARLRSESADRFAGMALGPDGVLEIFAVGNDPAFTAAVNDIRLAVAPQAAVRVIPGRAHSLASLEALRDQITATHDAIAARGVMVTGWGVDQRANKVRVGVLEPTPEALTLLTSEFGAEGILLVEQGAFAATPRQLEAPS